MNSNSESPRPEELIARTLRVRTGQPGASEAAAIRMGVSAATESHARPVTDVYLTGEGARGATGWRRAAAICATAARTPHVDKTPLGASLRRLHAAENERRAPKAGDSLVSQVASLPLLDLESAAQVIGLLVGRCAAHGIGVDFYALGRTLSRWGRGTNSRSRAVRTRIVDDFYRTTTTTEKKEA